jgi:hypothetical protein
VQDLTVEMLSPVPCFPRPFWTVSRLGFVRKMNLAALMVVLCVFDAIFPEFNGIFSCGRKDL